MPKLIISTLAAALVFVAVGGAQAAPSGIDRVIAVVNEGVILQSEFNQRLRDTHERIKAEGAKPPPEESLRRQILEQLILESLQLQMAARANIIVSDAELLDLIQELAAESKQSLEKFQKTIETRHHSSWQDYREQLRRQIILRRLQNAQLRRRVYISDANVDDFLNSGQGRRLAHLRYRLLYARLETKNAQAETCLRRLQERVGAGANLLAAIDTADEDCAWRGVDLGWREQAQLPSLFETAVPTMSAGELSRPLRNAEGLHLVQLIKIEGGERQLVDQTRVRHILMIPAPGRGPERVELELRDLLAKIKNGSDFGELAQIHSKDPGTRNEGGNLGWITAQELDPTFAKVMNDTAIGEISEPFESAFGWHILQTLERRRHDAGPERLRQQAFNILFQRKYNEELEAWFRDLRSNAHVELRL